MILVTFWLHTDEFIFVCPRALKLSYFDGRAPQLSSWVNHGTPAAGVIGHILYIRVYIVEITLKPFKINECTHPLY